MRWGILATGKISSDFCNALIQCEASQVVAIGSRSVESAKRFAANHGLLEAKCQCYGSYDELLKDEEVEVVYVGSINTAHFSNVMSCLEHGKHVLCEKPIGVNMKQAKQMVERAKEKKLFLGEGMWTRSFPATRKVAEILRSKALGEVVLCQGDLGFDIPPSVSRCYDLNQGGGALLDLGIYPLAWVLLAFEGKEVADVSSTASLHSDGADVSGVVTLKFSSDENSEADIAGIGTATFSFSAETQNEVWIVCTKGKVHISGKSAHTPEIVTITKRVETNEWSTETFEFPVPVYDCPTPMNFMNSTGFLYEVEHVEECLKEKKLESSNWSLQETLRCAEIMDQVRSIIGVKYPMDDAS